MWIQFSKFFLYKDDPQTSEETPVEITDHVINSVSLRTEMEVERAEIRRPQFIRIELENYRHEFFNPKIFQESSGVWLSTPLFPSTLFIDDDDYKYLVIKNDYGSGFVTYFIGKIMTDLRESLLYDLHDDELTITFTSLFGGLSKVTMSEIEGIYSLHKYNTDARKNVSIQGPLTSVLEKIFEHIGLNTSQLFYSGFSNYWSDTVNGHTLNFSNLWVEVPIWMNDFINKMTASEFLRLVCDVFVMYPRIHWQDGTPYVQLFPKWKFDDPVKLYVNHDMIESEQPQLEPWSLYTNDPVLIKTESELFDGTTVKQNFKFYDGQKGKYFVEQVGALAGSNLLRLASSGEVPPLGASIQASNHEDIYKVVQHIGYGAIRISPALSTTVYGGCTVYLKEDKSISIKNILNCIQVKLVRPDIWVSQNARGNEKIERFYHQGPGTGFNQYVKDENFILNVINGDARFALVPRLPTGSNDKMHPYGDAIIYIYSKSDNGRIKIRHAQSFIQSETGYQIDEQGTKDESLWIVAGYASGVYHEKDEDDDSEPDTDKTTTGDPQTNLLVFYGEHVYLHSHNNLNRMKLGLEKRGNEEILVKKEIREGFGIRQLLPGFKIKSKLFAMFFNSDNLNPDRDNNIYIYQQTFTNDLQAISGRIIAFPCFATKSTDHVDVLTSIPSDVYDLMINAGEASEPYSNMYFCTSTRVYKNNLSTPIIYWDLLPTPSFPLPGVSVSPTKVLLTKCRSSYKSYDNLIWVVDEFWGRAGVLDVQSNLFYGVLDGLDQPTFLRTMDFVRVWVNIKSRVEYEIRTIANWTAEKSSLFYNKRRRTAKINMRRTVPIEICDKVSMPENSVQSELSNFEGMVIGIEQQQSDGSSKIELLEK